MNPRDELYAALMRGDYSAITEDPSYPVENPRQVSVPGSLQEMMIRQQAAMEPEMSLRGIDQFYGKGQPIMGGTNGRGMISTATQGGDAAIPQNTNEFKIEAPTFAAAFRKMAEMGAPEGTNFIWYANGKPQGLYKFAYASGQQRKPVAKPEKKEQFLPGYNIITGKRPIQAGLGIKGEFSYPGGRTIEEQYPGIDPRVVMYDWNPMWKEGMKAGINATGF